MWDLLGSRELSVFIFIVIMVYSVIAYIFSLLVQPLWFDKFQKLLPLMVLYAAFFINLLICEIKWLPVVFRRCRRPFPPGLADLGRFSGVARIEGAEGLERLKSNLSRRFYKMSEYNEGDKGMVYALRGIYSPLGNLLFHLSFFFLLSGIIAGILFRVDGQVFVVEGERFDGKQGSYENLSISPLGEIPKVEFTLDSVTPEFWGSRMLFTDLVADITYGDGLKGKSWLSKQLKIGGAGISMQGLGYAPHYILKDNSGRELHNGISRVNVFMPGSEDAFRIPGYPHKFLFSYFPDARIRGDKVSNLSMYRVDPIIGLTVYRGRLPVFSGWLKEGEEAEFDGMKISFPEVKYWGDFKILKNPGFLWIWIAFAMMITGLVWRFVFYRREVLIVEDGTACQVYCRSEFFPRLFESRMMAMKDVL